MKDRACGGILPAGAPGCLMTQDSEDNACPEFAPVDEDGFVWCDCINGFGHVRLSATEDACLRTEGISDEQAIAYEAAGINVVDYDCNCCTCQSALAGIPKVGQPGKECDAGSLDPDNNGCGDSSYYMFAVVCGLLLLAGLLKKLSAVHEEDERAARTHGGKTDSADIQESDDAGMKQLGTFKKNPLMMCSDDDDDDDDDDE